MGEGKNKPLVISYNTLYIYIISGWLSGSINLQAAVKVFITSVQAKGRARHLHRINNQILLRVKQQMVYHNEEMTEHIHRSVCFLQTHS